MNNNSNNNNPQNNIFDKKHKNSKNKQISFSELNCISSHDTLKTITPPNSVINGNMNGNSNINNNNNEHHKNKSNSVKKYNMLKTTKENGIIEKSFKGKHTNTNTALNKGHHLIHNNSENIQSKLFHGINDNNCNTAYDNIYIDKKVPHLLTQLEKSVFKLKKFYNDIVIKHNQNKLVDQQQQQQQYNQNFNNVLAHGNGNIQSANIHNNNNNNNNCLHNSRYSNNHNNDNGNIGCISIANNDNSSNSKCKNNINGNTNEGISINNSNNNRKRDNNTGSISMNNSNNNITCNANMNNNIVNVDNNSYNSSSLNNMNKSQTNPKLDKNELFLLPKIDIDAVLKEYENIYKTQTKDINTLYDFYINNIAQKTSSSSSTTTTTLSTRSIITNNNDPNQCIEINNNSYQNIQKQQQSPLFNIDGLNLSNLTPNTIITSNNNNNNNNNNHINYYQDDNDYHDYTHHNGTIIPQTPTNTCRNEQSNQYYNKKDIIETNNDKYHIINDNNDHVDDKNNQYNKDKNSCFNNNNNNNNNVILNNNDIDSNAKSPLVIIDLKAQKQIKKSPQYKRNYAESVSNSSKLSLNLKLVTEDNSAYNTNRSTVQKSPIFDCSRNLYLNSISMSTFDNNKQKSINSIDSYNSILNPVTPKTFLDGLNKPKFFKAVNSPYSSPVAFHGNSNVIFTETTNFNIKDDISSKSKCEITTDKISMSSTQSLRSIFPLNLYKTQNFITEYPGFKTPEKETSTVTTPNLTLTKDKHFSSSLFHLNHMKNSVLNSRTFLQSADTLELLNQNKPIIQTKSEMNKDINVKALSNNAIFNEKNIQAINLIKVSNEHINTQSEACTNKDNKIYDKIFEKNMLINKLKQDLNQNLQALTSNLSTNNSDQTKTKKLLNFGGENFPDILKTKNNNNNNNSNNNNNTEDQPWAITKNIYTDNLDKAVIEKFSDEEKDLSLENIKSNKDNFILTEEIFGDSLFSPKELNQKQSEVNNTYEKNKLDELKKKPLPLNQADLKLLDNLQQMANLLNEKEILNLLDKKEDPNLFNTLKKKIEMKENFKKTKWYVPEIPARKPRILENIQKQNEEEEKRHEKELNEFFNNNKLLVELEDILDHSNDNNDPLNHFSSQKNQEYMLQLQSNNYNKEDNIQKCILTTINDNNNNHYTKENKKGNTINNANNNNNNNIDNIQFDENSFTEGLQNAINEKDNIEDIGNITFELDKSKIENTLNKELRQINNLNGLYEGKKKLEMNVKYSKGDKINNPQLVQNNQSNETTNNIEISSEKQNNTNETKANDTNTCLIIERSTNDQIISDERSDVKVNTKLKNVEDKLKSLKHADKKLNKVLLVLKKEQSNLKDTGEMDNNLEQKIVKYEHKKNQIQLKIQKYSKKLDIAISCATLDN